MSKTIYVVTFEDGEKYVGFCDTECPRLRPHFEGRVGFAGRLSTKFQEQNRCWGYTAPVYVKSRTVPFTVKLAAVVPTVEAARARKREEAAWLRDRGAVVINS